MKKLLSILLITISVFIFTSCESNNAKQIIGHTYAMVESSTNMLSIYFSPSGSAVVHLIQDGVSSNTPHYIYHIKGNTVEICCNYSNYWKEEYQGTIVLALTYHPEEDALYYITDVLYRVD